MSLHLQMMKNIHLIQLRDYIKTSLLRGSGVSDRALQNEVAARPAASPAAQLRAAAEPSAGPSQGAAAGQQVRVLTWSMKPLCCILQPDCAHMNKTLAVV